MKKRFDAEQTIPILRQADVSGAQVREVWRRQNITEQNFFRWPKKYGDLDMSHMSLDYGISGGYVARVLEAVGQFRGFLRAIRTDQAPEITSRVLDRSAYGRGIDLKLITAGKPTPNTYIESFNGTFRDECPNDDYLKKLAHARAVIAEWRRDYSEARPDSGIGRVPSAEFAARHRLGPGKATEWEIV